MEQALNRVQTSDTNKTAVVQATTLYVFTLRISHLCHQSTTWCLLGTLTRKAVLMGLHRDPSRFTEFTPFEAEMRRRLWWAICLVDWQCGDMQYSELSISERTFDTELPASIEDQDLYPGMCSAATPHTGLTDSTVFLIRCELWRLTQRLQSATTVLPAEQQRLKHTDALRLLYDSTQSLKEKYLIHLDHSRPLYSFMWSTVRMVLAKAELVVHHQHLFPKLDCKILPPRPPSPPFLSTCPLTAQGGAPQQVPSRNSEDHLFACALALVEHANAHQSGQSYYRQWHKWSWYVQAHVQWHAMAILLKQLGIHGGSARDPWDATYHRAWIAVQSYVQSVPQMARQGSLWRLICTLMGVVQQQQQQQHHLASQLHRALDSHPVGGRWEIANNPTCGVAGIAEIYSAIRTELTQMRGDYASNAGKLGGADHGGADHQMTANGLDNIFPQLVAHLPPDAVSTVRIPNSDDLLGVTGDPRQQPPISSLHEELDDGELLQFPSDQWLCLGTEYLGYDFDTGLERLNPEEGFQGWLES
jgi:hypothetical protein